MERASASTGWPPRLLLAKLSDAAGTLGCRVETPKSAVHRKRAVPFLYAPWREIRRWAGGAHLPSFLFGRRAWFSAGGLAGEHRLPHLRAHRRFHGVWSSETLLDPPWGVASTCRSFTIRSLEAESTRQSVQSQSGGEHERAEMRHDRGRRSAEIHQLMKGVHGEARRQEYRQFLRPRRSDFNGPPTAARPASTLLRITPRPRTCPSVRPMLPRSMASAAASAP